MDAEGRHNMLGWKQRTFTSCSTKAAGSSHLCNFFLPPNPVGLIWRCCTHSLCESFCVSGEELRAFGAPVFLIGSQKTGPLLPQKDMISITLGSEQTISILDSEPAVSISMGFVLYRYPWRNGLEQKLLTLCFMRDLGELFPNNVILFSDVQGWEGHVTTSKSGL